MIVLIFSSLLSHCLLRGFFNAHEYNTLLIKVKHENFECMGIMQDNLCHRLSITVLSDTCISLANFIFSSFSVCCLFVQEVAHLRRELLIAARHILATEMRNSEGVGGARVGKGRERREREKI